MIRMRRASGSAKKSPCWKPVTSKPPPSLACVNQTKVFPRPRVFQVLTQPLPATTPKKKVSLKLVFFFSLIIHCTEITFQLSTISEPFFSQTKITFFVWVFSHISLPLCCLHDSKLKWLHTNWKQSNYD